jgi:hypothetical protein
MGIQRTDKLHTDLCKNVSFGFKVMKVPFHLTLVESFDV